MADNKNNGENNDQMLEQLSASLGKIFSKAITTLNSAENKFASAFSKSLPINTTSAEEIDEDAKHRLNPYCNYITDPKWRLNGKPKLLSEKFVIANSWRRDEVLANAQYQGRQLIIIDPGLAFGNIHYTTTASIKVIEQYWQGGRMLDVGAGTGILSMAAALLHPTARIDAFDISTVSVEQAQLHLELNGLTDRIALKESMIASYPPAAYDMVIGNLLPDIIVGMKDDLAARVKPGGLLAPSGIRHQPEGERIRAQFGAENFVSSNIIADEIAAMFAGLGMQTIDCIKLADWAALVLRKPEEKK
jgi:ribosomal protein L11 methylase PrmA